MSPTAWPALLLATTTLACSDLPAPLAVDGLSAQLSSRRCHARGALELWADGCGFTARRLEIDAGCSSLLTWQHAKVASCPTDDDDACTLTDVVSHANLTVDPSVGLFGVDVNVSFAPGTLWSEVGALVLWDGAAGAVAAHVVLQKLQPGAQLVLAPQPTHFESCLQLSSTFRLRWTVLADENAVELGLEAQLGDDEYLAFGPAAPGVTNRLMGGADCVVAGVDAGAVRRHATEPDPSTSRSANSGFLICLLTRSHPASRHPNRRSRSTRTSRPTRSAGETTAARCTACVPTRRGRGATREATREATRPPTTRSCCTPR